jgi:hypothetical protein
MDRKGSHVLQAVLRRVPQILIQEHEQGEADVEAFEPEDEDGEEARPPSMTLVFKALCLELKESWLDVNLWCASEHRYPRRRLIRHLP